MPAFFNPANSISRMTAAFWTIDNLAMVITSLVMGAFALAFFTVVFVADRGDAKRRAQAKRASRRARRHFARSAHKSEPGREAGV